MPGGVIAPAAIATVITPSASRVGTLFGAGLDRGAEMEEDDEKYAEYQPKNLII